MSQYNWKNYSGYLLEKSELKKSEPLAKNYFKAMLNKINSGQNPDTKPTVNIWDEIKAGIISDIRDKGGNPWPKDGQNHQDLFTLHAKLALKYNTRDKKAEDPIPR